ncbi:MAG: hypothetical protein JXN64_10615 [Spirochaetes bacterium]|nr:hypothetical protein [Spirochaetota bacterium]
MQTVEKLTTEGLKQIIKDSVRETLSEKKLKNIFHEVIEDIALSKAIDEGMKTVSVNKDDFLKKLKSRI